LRAPSRSVARKVAFCSSHSGVGTVMLCMVKLVSAHGRARSIMNSCAAWVPLVRTYGSSFPVQPSCCWATASNLIKTLVIFGGGKCILTVISGVVMLVVWMERRKMSRLSLRLKESVSLAPPPLESVSVTESDSVKLPMDSETVSLTEVERELVVVRLSEMDSESVKERVALSSESVTESVTLRESLPSETLKVSVTVADSLTVRLRDVETVPLSERLRLALWVRLVEWEILELAERDSVLLAVRLWELLADSVAVGVRLALWERLTL
jgi:hypothetical protein